MKLCNVAEGKSWKTFFPYVLATFMILLSKSSIKKFGSGGKKLGRSGYRKQNTFFIWPKVSSVSEWKSYSLDKIMFLKIHSNNLSINSARCIYVRDSAYFLMICAWAQPKNYFKPRRSDMFGFIGWEFPPNVNSAKILHLHMRVNAKFGMTGNKRSPMDGGMGITVKRTCLSQTGGWGSCRASTQWCFVTCEDKIWYLFCTIIADKCCFLYRSFRLLSYIPYTELIGEFTTSKW